MAYVNVEEWSSDEVSNWMKGLEPFLSSYVNELWEAGVTGKQLLQLEPDMLPRFGIHKIGHQELLLQAIAHLRNIHYQLDKETLQQLALRLSSRARSVYNELKPSHGSSLDNGHNGCDDDYINSDDQDNKKASQKKCHLVSTAVVAGVADCLAALKTVVSWLNRAPFDNLLLYKQPLEELTDLGIRLATISQRDQFAENQATIIRDNCKELAQIADNIIQNFNDPLIIQPASLVVATIKKKHDDDLGVHLMTTYDGVHQVSIIRPHTPADTCTKLSVGDQLIQINYDTVIGWTPEKITKALSENPLEVILTVKKQPRHAPGAQQIYSYFKPFRLPSKKRTYNHGYPPQNEYSYRNNFTNNLTNNLSNNLNFYSLLDQSASNRQIIPKAAAVTPMNRVLQVPSVLRPVSPDQPQPPWSGSPQAPAPECSEVVVSFTVSEALSPTASSASSVLAASPLLPPSAHNTSDSGTRPTHDDDDDDDDPFTSSDEELSAHHDGEDDVASTSGASVRLYPPKPRAPVHRRATIPGDTAPPVIAAATLNQYIEGLRKSGLALRGRVSSGDQRDAVRQSPEIRARPHTIGAAKLLRDSGPDPHKPEDRLVPSQAPVGPVSLPAKVSATAALVDRESPVARPMLSLDGVGGADGVGVPPPSIGITSDMPLPFTITSPPTPLTPNPPSTPHTPGGRRVSEDRPRLDKSHSTPAYDFGSDGAPATNTAPSSGALLVPGSAPAAAAAGGHRNLQLPGLEPNIKVQSGQQQKKHLPGVCGGGRGVSCRELGAADHQGWLYRRSKGTRHFLHQHSWERRWFKLKKGYLYGYASEDALKAESLIYLPGFHVCPAQDAKTKKFAFKIYHANGAMFLFACDTSEERSRWMSEMGLSALSSGRCGDAPSSPSAAGPASSTSPTSSSSCSSPTLLPQHLEEAYYSETDDECDDSFTAAEPVSSPHPLDTAIPTTSTPVAPSSSSSAFSALFHWGSGGKTGTSTTPSGGGTRASALSSFLKPKQVQAVPSTNFRSYRRVRETGRSTSTSDLRPSGVCEAPPLTPTTPQHAPPPSKANAVARKGSLREKLRSHLPSALTLDRRRKNQQQAAIVKKKSQTDPKTSAESSLDASDVAFSSSDGDKILEESSNVDDTFDASGNLESGVSMSRDQASLESNQTASHEAEFDASVSAEDKSESKCGGESKMQPVTPLKCKLIDASLKGSLDCLSATSAAYVYGAPFRTTGESGQKSWMSTLRSSPGDVSSSSGGAFKTKKRPSPLPQHQHHSSSGTSSSHLSSNNNSPNSPSGDTFGFSTSLVDAGGSSRSLSHTSSLTEHRSSGEPRPSSIERLKRTGNYKPVILKGKEPMRAAFVLGLDQRDMDSSLHGRNSALTSTPNSSLLNSSTLGPSVRPQVPPRTKFLSPSERTTQRRSDVSFGSSSSSSAALSSSRDDTWHGAATSPSVANDSSLLFSPILAYKVSGSGAGSAVQDNRQKGSQLSRLDIVQPSSRADDQDQPKTPLKHCSSYPASHQPSDVARARPAMGVSMIGKQRRTPGVLSPREVFFCSPPPSPSPSSTTTTTGSNAATTTPSQHHYLPNTTLASTSCDLASSTSRGPSNYNNSTPNNSSNNSTNVNAAHTSTPNIPAHNTTIINTTPMNPAGNVSPLNTSYNLNRQSVGRHALGSSSGSQVADAKPALGSLEASPGDDFSAVDSRAPRVMSYTGLDGKPLMVLPHYPDMEYPPTFEAGSYTIPGSSSPSSTPCNHPPCTSHCSPHDSSSHHFSSPPSSHGSAIPRGHRHHGGHKVRSQPPSYTPRTPRSPTLYYNLQGFNSASLPSLPSEGHETTTVPLCQRPQMPLPHSSTSLSASGGLSLHIPAQPSLSPQVSPECSSSPRVIVGISCSDGDCVVSHHHSIYVTSPVKPNNQPRPRLDPPMRVSSESQLSDRSPSAVNTSSNVQDSAQKPSRRRTPPGFIGASQSNSSLENIYEHAPVARSGSGAIVLSGVVGSNGNGRSGGSATVLNPLLKNDPERTYDSVNVKCFQFGGSSGGTVITTPSDHSYARPLPTSMSLEHKLGVEKEDNLRAATKDDTDFIPSTSGPGRPMLDPPRLILPGPPSDPPPDD
ncbi:mucin-17 isoform X2 [Hyalella azteca]|uniref:Mucin-17 isoform X2 n=1 Tax=Hyalella azteca TaxID=294128 RepID=A0A979FFU9_HYAAZ|nr:mucin-17 isoform X2 [Hyalella azteca]